MGADQINPGSKSLSRVQKLPEQPGSNSKLGDRDPNATTQRILTEHATISVFLLVTGQTGTSHTRLMAVQAPEIRI